MVLIRNSDVTLQETPGGMASGALATPSRGATDVSVIRQQTQPGGNNPLHYHDRAEVLFLRSGSLNITVADEIVPMVAGDTLIIPANVVHQLANSADSIAEWLIIAPAGVRFFGADGNEMQPQWAK